MARAARVARVAGVVRVAGGGQGGQGGQEDCTYKFLGKFSHSLYLFFIIPNVPSNKLVCW